jgi:hypothetical protein
MHRRIALAQRMHCKLLDRSGTGVRSTYSNPHLDYICVSLVVSLLIFLGTFLEKLQGRVGCGLSAVRNCAQF